jgi:hypothetical protein
MPGSTTTPRTGSPGSWPINREGIAGAGLDRREELQQRLRQGPPAQAPTPTGAKAGGPAVAKADEPEAVTPAAASDGPAPGRWTLEGIRTTFAWLKG